MVQHHFRRRLVEELLEYSGQTNVAPVGRPAPKVLERLTGRHFVDKFIEGGKTLHRQCIVCGPAERKMCDAVRPGEKCRFGHMTSYKCKQCNVPLCITPCFEIFHTKQEPFLAYKRMKSAEANCNTEEWYDITLLLSVGVCIYSEAINFVSYFALLLDTCTCTCMYKYNHEQQSLRSKLIHKTAQFNNS